MATLESLKDTADAVDTPYTIHTSRLTLRSFDPTNPTDYERMLATYNDPFVIKAIGDRKVRTHAEFDRKCEEVATSPSICIDGRIPPPTRPFHLIYLRETGEYVGNMALLHRKPYIPDLGYSFFEHTSGKGYATEAGIALLRFWREEIGVKEIFIMADEVNRGSQRVAEKCGLVPGGVIYWDKPGEGKKPLITFVLPGMKPFPEGFMMD